MSDDMEKHKVKGVVFSGQVYDVLNGWDVTIQHWPNGTTGVKTVAMRSSGEGEKAKYETREYNVPTKLLIVRNL